MKQSLFVVVLSVVFTLLGLVGGWFASGQTSKGGGDAHAGHAEEKGDAHEAHGPAKPAISAETAKSLGISVAAAETKMYYKYQAIPAVIVENPASSQPIVAPIGGTIAEVHVHAGSLIKSGETVITIIREAISRPTLILTEEIIKPASEQVHSSVGELRRALRGVEIFKTELERLKKFTQTGTVDGMPIIPKKNEIDLRYELSRAEQELENAHEKLRLHGFSDEQINSVEKGAPLVALNQAIWKRALQRNGLWPETADAIFSVLSERAQSIAWNVAAIGELAGAGLATQELADWLKADVDRGTHFLEIAGLLQKGSTLSEIEALHKANGLEPIVKITAPTFKDIGDWDIEAILVRPFDKVVAGAKLAELVNRKHMRIKTEPVGGETPGILKALQQGLELEAKPLVEGSGPTLTGLKISYVGSDEHAQGIVAYIQAQNTPLYLRDEGDHGKFRTWQLRAGQRYTLRIPTDKFENVYVVPSDAVTDDGPDKVVFIQDGDAYKIVKVVLLYQDHEVSVIDSKHSDIFPGDQVVQKGAFGLGLALKAGSGNADPHAGHNH